MKGYALPSPGAPIARVDVRVVATTKGSHMSTSAPTKDPTPSEWQPASITYQEGPWSWVLWEACLSVPDDIVRAGGGKVQSRAVDESGRMQRGGEEVQWNLRGMGYDGFGEREFWI